LIEAVVIMRWYCCVAGSMMNVGVQCCKRSGVSISVRAREKIRVDPFGSKQKYIQLYFTISVAREEKNEINKLL